ncbi:EF-hand domain-containing protein [Pseudoalteromonas lipolytica]
MSKYTFASLIICGLYSSMVFATESIGEKFKQLDRDEDGFLSRSESARDPALWSRFKSYDSDKDNRLSFAEFNEYASK